MKKKTVFVIVMAILIVLFIGATLFSIYKFDVVNPYSACFGMVKILFTNSDYVEVQNFPKKVIFAKPNNSEQLLMEYMKNRGFYNIPDLRLGAVYTFSNGVEYEEVYFSGNKYYAEWEITKKNLNIENNTDIAIKKTIPEGSIIINKTNISLNEAIIKITDKNEIKCEEINNFELSKYIKNENYTGVGEYFGVNSENSTMGFTGTGAEYIWSNLPKLLTDSESLEIINSENETTIKVNFKNAYTKLDSGKYTLTLVNKDYTYSIDVEFEITDNEEIEIISSKVNR